MSELVKTDKWATTKLSRAARARQGGAFPLVSLDWNGWSVSSGISGQVAPEYALNPHSGIIAHVRPKRKRHTGPKSFPKNMDKGPFPGRDPSSATVSYTHLRAHATRH